MNEVETKPRSPASEKANDYDVVVIGAGIAGIYQAYRLREMGLRFRVLEAGSGVGGTWYWNRYPGARFDSESYSYAYSFSQELLAEWNWTEHFAAQPETLSYLNYVTDKFELRSDMQFNSRVKSAHYNESDCKWIVTIEDGSAFSCRFLITALGPLSAPTMPNYEGLGEFTGESYQASLWPKEPVSFAGKRVAVIGTGSSGVQLIQEISKTAKQLTVFQRTPNWCVPLRNAPITKEEMESLRAGYPEMFERCQASPGCFIHAPDPRLTMEVPTDEREAFWEKQYNAPGFGLWMGNFRDAFISEEANAVLSDFVARKIRQRVKNPAVAEKLIPKNHGFGTRRVPLETNYYEVYNQPNVRLIDVNDSPIKRVTANGLMTSSEEFEFDMIVYATGFDALTGSFDRIDIRGENGVPLKKAWEHGPETFLGIFVAGFPNFMMIAGPHMALGNAPRGIEYGSEWISGLLRFAAQKNITRIAAPFEAMQSWTEYVRGLGTELLATKIDSWMTGVNKNVAGKTQRCVIRYNGPATEYRKKCDEVAKANYQQLDLS
ncbi:NAD(P)/FAD-dependent oxidoreductase [Variovorax ureilyticus]|uniref:NAD(P)/FAD-dependent oxidoreductase n=1 Tax=Variovorax ureilyticus TaxID=1836198 RepID=A0ABU8VMT8_9BURK